MKKLIAILATITLIVSWTPVVHAEISAEKRTEIEKMLRLTGTEKMMTQVMTNMITVFQKQMPSVSQDYWDGIMKKVDVREITEKLIPVYDKYYTLEDLKAVNAFYESPAGQKILATLPQVTQKAMQIGQEWGLKLGKQVAAELEAQRKQK